MNCFWRVIIVSLVGVGSLAGSFPCESVAAPSAVPSIRHHQLAVELIPQSHELIATDHITVVTGNAGQPFTVSLAASLQIERIELAGPCATPCRPGDTIEFESIASAKQSGTRRVVVKAPPPREDGVIEVTLRYRGEINDPPRDPRHLRFVTPSETSGHIGSNGVYLSSETQWYPDIEGSLATFDVTIAVPEGWATVTQGESQADGRHWVVSSPSEALTVVANRFVVKTREWQSRSGQSVRLATYLFPDEAALADEYLDASARYLDAYIPILGPYPFPKFAVVENFFSSGLGMPSFTLLGSGVIKRHYTQPYALGHEIVHSWIGNGVFNRVDRGNWVEGLTTYLANYYYHELTGDVAQAREQRRLMVLGYSVYVNSEVDYPVGAFTRKSDEKDNAIGYQKSAMVFHLLRQEVGEAQFWPGLRTLVARYQGRAADWKDIEDIFQAAAGRDLRWFFAQWVEQPGAPAVVLESVKIRPNPETSQKQDDTQVDVRIAQGSTAHRIPVELEFAFPEGQTHRVRVAVTRSIEEVTLALPHRPVSVRADPDYHLFRRIGRSDLIPMLNLYVTDRIRAVVPPSGQETNSPDPFGELIKRIEMQEADKPAGERTAILGNYRAGEVLPPGSILALGWENHTPAIAEVSRACGDRMRLTEKGFVIDSQTYEGQTMAVIASCRRHERPGSVMTLVYGVTPQALTRVARLLFFYGWQSYVIFHEGAVVARGDWDDTMNAEVRIEAN